MAPGTPQRRYALRSRSFMGIGVGAHRLITPLQARESQ